MQQKHQRELEAVTMECQEKKLQVQRLQNDLKEFQDSKYSLKGRLEDYEEKIKKMIQEFEAESKRHIKEVNDIHYSYRGFKTKAQELEQRIETYKRDCLKAQAAEKKAQKGTKQMTFRCDELEEKLRYTEQKYHALINRLGASQQDIDHIEEELMFKRGGEYSYGKNLRNSKVSTNEGNKASRGGRYQYQEADDSDDYGFENHEEEKEQEMDLQTIRDEKGDSQSQVQSIIEMRRQGQENRIQN